MPGEGQTYKRFPFISLSEGEERVRILWEKEARASMTPAVAFKHWDYSDKSSSAHKTIAALKHFGLIEKAGVGRIKVSERAVEILRDQMEGQPRRMKALREAALSPVLFREVLAHFPDGLPSDTNIVSFLEMDLHLSEAVAKSVVENIRKSLAYAGIDPSVTIPSMALEAPAEEEGQIVPVSPVLPAKPSAGTQKPQLSQSPALRRIVLPVEGGELQMSFPEQMSKKSFKVVLDILTALEPKDG